MDQHTDPTVLLVGGSSEIGRAVALALLGDRPGRVVLAGRPGPRRHDAAEALRVLGHRVDELDYEAADDRTTVEALVARATEALGRTDAVVIAVGTLGPRPADPDGGSVRPVGEPQLAELLTVNLLGPALVADVAADLLVAQGGGHLVVLTSAAAARPRQEILGYATAKQALDTYVRGLDARTRPHGVRCLVVRPGRVRTRMTAGLPEAPLTTTPELVASRVRRAVRGRWSAGRGVVWSPALMGPATQGLRALPAPLLPRVLR